MDDNTFRLFTSNNLETLAELYSQKRNEKPSRFRKMNFFAAEKICVATRGMGTWLEQWLVKKGHVIANVAFPFIRDAIDDILMRFMNTQQDGDSYHPELFKEDVLIWRIYRLLDNATHSDELKILKDYLALAPEKNTDGAPRNDLPDVRRYQLARKLAQLYYEYMAFVPEKLLYPEKNGISKENQWQIALWKELCVDIHGRKIVSPAEAMMRFLHNGTILQSESFEPVTFFGVSAMAPYFLLVLKKLSTVQPVNFFYLNHCADLWDDVTANWEHNLPEPEGFSEHFNNTLLGNFGTQGREFFKAIIELEGIDESDHFDYSREWENQKSNDKLNAGIPLLKEIQTRILENVGDDTEIKANGTTDDSLTIHSCFNEIREVESLHDSILHILKQYEARKEKITLNDIIVMAPDIAKFAPAIQAVFDRGPLSKHYCISDRSVKGANLLAEAFMKIMELPKSKFEVTRISSLLDSSPIKERFGFDDEGVARLRNWFRKAGIHWGRDEKDREGIGAFEEFSWQKGLDTLLAKLAFDENGQVNEYFGGIAPTDYSTDNENQSLLNGFMKLYGELKEFAAAVEQSRHAESAKSGPQWCDFLLEKRGQFFPVDGDSMQEYSQLGKVFSEMKEAMTLAGYAKTDDSAETTSDADIVPYDIILSALGTAMDTPAKGEPFLNGKITFCSLLPMRGIPCKVIALLGMDVGEFPRSNDNTGFTLVTRKDRNGKEIAGSLLKYYDRSRSIEDRFTFLEALMSARDHMMLFYKGQSDQNLKDDLVPAAPLAELMNYIARIRPNAHAPIIKHTLNSFDAKAFSNTSRDKTLLDYFSFDQNMAEIATTTASQSQSSTKLPPWLDAYNLPLPKQLPQNWDKDEITITLDDMVSFFKDPATAYVTTRMGLPRDRWEEEPLSDFEPFALNPLDASLIRNALTAEQTKGSGPTATLDSSPAWHAAVANNSLPIGPLGEIDFCQQQINSWILDETFRNELRQQEESEEEEFEVDLGMITPSINAGLVDRLRMYARDFKNDSSENAPAEFAVEMPAFPPKHVRITAKFKYFHGNDESPKGIRCRINSAVNGRHLIPIILKHLILAAQDETDTLSKYHHTTQDNRNKAKSEEIIALAALDFSNDEHSPFGNLRTLASHMNEFRQYAEANGLRNDRLAEIMAFLEHPERLSELLDKYTGTFQDAFKTLVEGSAELLAQHAKEIANTHREKLAKLLEKCQNDGTHSIDACFVDYKKFEDILKNVAKGRTSSATKEEANKLLGKTDEINTLMDSLRQDYDELTNGISELLEHLEDEYDGTEEDECLEDFVSNLSLALESVFPKNDKCRNTITAKWQLVSMAKLYLLGHLYPLPLFGKASPQRKLNIRDCLKTSDNAARLFDDFRSIPKFSENAVMLLKDFAGECFPKFEKEKSNASNVEIEIQN
ncbi:MAG: exodeoxyribonuclease V subunit gamma [Lentisphaeria bacterium]|nr:exodeoxyribonuclease V subunit gamma [Lentisphaeria bacterium]